MGIRAAKGRRTGSPRKARWGYPAATASTPGGGVGPTRYPRRSIATPERVGGVAARGRRAGCPGISSDFAGPGATISPASRCTRRGPCRRRYALSIIPSSTLG